MSPDTKSKTATFEARRPALLGLAYRILGSLADAEDAVQDTYLKWSRVDHAKLDDEQAWLTTVCTRRCLDMLRAAYRKRVDYVGAWLPEPVLTTDPDDPESRVALASSLTTAFVLMLERLTPKERAAYLLHTIFDTPYADIAKALGLQESTCRKLVSRAKRNVEAAKIRADVPHDRQKLLLAAFQSAVTTGRTDQLQDLLADDIRLCADGGGKVPAIRKILHGSSDVCAFLTDNLRRYWQGCDWVAVDLNGMTGFLIRQDDAVIAAVTFGYHDDNRACDVFITRNPDKLARLAPVALL